MSDERRTGEQGGGRRRGRSVARALSVFLLLLLSAWAAIGVVLAPVLPGGPLGAIALAILGTPVPLALILGQRVGNGYPGRWTRLLLMRPFWYLQLFVLLAGPLTLVGLAVGALVGAARTGGVLALGGAATVFALGALAGYAGSRRLAVRRLEARWPDLPAGLDGLRIVQLSDLHVGPQTSRRFLARVARQVAEAAPELIVVTGDLIDDHAADVDHYAAAFGALTAPLGVYSIPGNHDVYAGWPAVRERLAALPQRVLVNEAVLVERGGARLAIVGTGDPAGGRGGTVTGGPDIAAALAAVPADSFVLALAHNPALWPALADRAVPLTLSGHTHWGQFALPALGWSLASPFLEHSMGSYARGGSLLYIHPGTNYWGVPFRLGTPPEVAVLTLRRGETGVVGSKE